MRLLEICIKREERRIRMTVDMESPDCFLTSQVPHIPRRLFQLIPRLTHHTCHNGKRKSFLEECRSTEIPHLFEHLVIELQLMAHQNPDDHLCGETEWNWHVDPQGRYRVTVDYEDEIVALTSIRLAERILAALDRHDADINIDADIERLRLIYQTGRELVGAASPQWIPRTKRSWMAIEPPTANPVTTPLPPSHAEPKSL